MLTIKNHNGEIRYMSDEVYTILDCGSHTNYPAGTLVRLISGVDDSNIPGYHFEKGWVTVCPVGATASMALGLPRKSIKKVG